MKKTITLLFLVGVFNVLAAQTYVISSENSSIDWLGEKVTGEHTGNIEINSGEFSIKNNGIVSGTFSIDMQSITCTDLKDETWNKKLVDHLKSDDFFSVDKYPETTFMIKESGDFSNGSAIVKGDLTIKGKTHPIEFRATLQETDDGLKIYGNVVVDRTKYNVKYGSGSFFSNLGDKTIYDEFKLKLNLLAVKK